MYFNCVFTLFLYLFLWKLYLQGTIVNESFCQDCWTENQSPDQVQEENNGFIWNWENSTKVQGREPANRNVQTQVRGAGVGR